ncbi:hypothetical protein D3C86_1795240 [compost metagenome]
MKTEDAAKPVPKWLKGTKTVGITWDQNKETGVNTSGGGYRVYIGNVSGFDLSEAPYFDVTYDSVAAATPLTTKITTLMPGTYYLKVAGFSAQGLGVASSEVTVSVP